MNYRNIFVYLIILFFTFPAFSQSWESVKKDPLFLYGEGFGVTVAEADQAALNDLISKISVQVSSKTTQEMSGNITNGQLSSQESFGMIMNTYSQATLTNTERLIITNEPDAHVGRWIKKSEIERIFENRKERIRSMMEVALRAESKGKIDDALRNYYWGLLLTRSLQYPNEAFYEHEGKKSLLMTWIPERMNAIFSEIDVKTIKTSDNGDVELNFSYKDIPVNSVDYTYFDGRDWSNVYSAKDGIGILEMAPGDVRDVYQLKFEYEYRGQAHIDKELMSVMGIMKSIPMRSAYKNVSAKVPKSNSSMSSTANSHAGGISLSENSTSQADFNSFSSVPTAIYKMPKELEDDTKHREILTKIISVFRSGTKESVASYFTKTGWDVCQRLLVYGSAKVVGEPDLQFYRLGSEVIGRGLQMSFSFKTGVRKAFVQDVVFTFNADNKIDNISFGLGKTANDDILGKSVWPEEVRMAIMQFLENYQTAYALKRLDYIESVFDEDAVIITGSLVPRKTITDGGGYVLTDKVVKYSRYNKESYIRHLKQSFASKEYINLRFANNDVRKLSKGGELYAIQIYQEYYSSNYGDKGYLFLMVDLNNPDQPVIKVRTWQPDKDPEFGVYGPEHFK